MQWHAGKCPEQTCCCNLRVPHSKITATRSNWTSGNSSRHELIKVQFVTYVTRNVLAIELLG